MFDNAWNGEDNTKILQIVLYSRRTSKICNKSQVDVTEDPLCKEKVIFTLHFKHLQSSDASLLLCLARACRGHGAIADHSDEDVLPILLVGRWPSAVTLNIN